jgi:ketosteroid isomerase-like protein
MQEQIESGLSAQDLAAIRASGEQFARLLLARDFDALVGLYAEDAVFMPPHHPAVKGRAALRSWMAAFPAVSRFTTEIEAIDGRQDLAYVRGTYAMTLEPEGAPGPVEDAGKFVEIRQKQPDGAWLLIGDIFNSDRT